jgi:hypothetical protein
MVIITIITIERTVLSQAAKPRSRETISSIRRDREITKQCVPRPEEGAVNPEACECYVRLVITYTDSNLLPFIAFRSWSVQNSRQAQHTSIHLI